MAIKGRGASHNPANRFEPIYLEPVVDELAPAVEPALPATTMMRDAARAALARNDSPDIPFEFSLNPYRGCEHGCIYCYARPTHEYLGFSAGLDFETKIVVKHDAPLLLEKQFQSPNWQPQTIALSGNTDCYQPAEKKLELTRRCLLVCLKYRNPVSIITKNALVLRDLDILRELASFDLVGVNLSLTTLDHGLARIMEPRTSTPQRRLEALARLSTAGIPTGINIAPIIPALNEPEIERLIQAGVEAGAQGASYILLRLPHGVKELFQRWLQEHFPDRAARILNAIRSMRDGELYRSEFFSRMRGTGARAELIHRRFKLACKKFGIDRRRPPLATHHFLRKPEQLSLF